MSSSVGRTISNAYRTGTKPRGSRADRVPGGSSDVMMLAVRDHAIGPCASAISRCRARIQSSIVA
jgi:hypothetical protein